MEPELSDRYRDQFGRFPVRLSILTDGAEVDRIFTFEPGAAAAAVLLRTPAARFGVLADAMIRDSVSGIAIEVA